MMQLMLLKEDDGKWEPKQNIINEYLQLLVGLGEKLLMLVTEFIL